MAMSPSTSKTNNRKRNLKVSTLPTHEEFEHLPRSPVDRFFRPQKQLKLDLHLDNPFCSDDEQDNDPKSPDYSPSAGYHPINDEQIPFKGFSYVGKIDDSEQNSEEQDDSALEVECVQQVGALMLPTIEHMIPKAVMEAFWSYEDVLDSKGECSRVRHKFKEFWEAFLCYLDKEENYDTSKMDEKKELKQEIKKIFKILATRYDEEKRCEKLGIFLRSFDALNDDEDDDGEKTEFSEKNLLNHFRLDKRMYGDVREKHVKKLFKKLSKVKNG